MLTYAPFLRLFIVIVFSLVYLVFDLYGMIPYLFCLTPLLFQIGNFDLEQEATPIFDDQLLEDVSRAVRSSAPKVTPGIGKDISIVRRQISPHKVGSSASRRIEALHASATHSQHSVDGPNSLEVAMR